MSEREGSNGGRYSVNGGREREGGGERGRKIDIGSDEVRQEMEKEAMTADTGINGERREGKERERDGNF